MSDEFETARQFITHPAAIGAAMALLGWLANKVYQGIGHRIKDVEKAQKLASDAAWKELDKRIIADEKIYDLMREHEQKDSDRFESINNDSRDRHDELMAIIGDLRVDIGGIKK